MSQELKTSKTYRLTISLTEEVQDYSDELGWNRSETVKPFELLAETMSWSVRELAQAEYQKHVELGCGSGFGAGDWAR